MAERGRPRNFDRDAALRAAMKVFWKRGYESASMAELTRAMGINAPSLYACFGSKEELFIAAVRLYLETEDRQSQTALESEPTARGGIGAMLRHIAGTLVRPGHPHGCLVVLGDANATAGSERIRHYLAQRRQEAEAGLEARLRRGIAAGDVPAEADVKAMAGFYMTVLQGLSLRARDGASAEAMRRVVDSAMTAWDSLAIGPDRKQSAAKTVARRR